MRALTWVALFEVRTARLQAFDCRWQVGLAARTPTHSSAREAGSVRRNPGITNSLTEPSITRREPLRSWDRDPRVEAMSRQDPLQRTIERVPRARPQRRMRHEELGLLVSFSAR
jgi:hypothetical protein